MNILILDDHISNINADPKLKFLFMISGCFSIHHIFLPSDGAVESVHYTSELDQQAVTNEFDYSTIVLGDERFQHLVPQVGEMPKRTRFVCPHEARIADHVGGQNGG